MYHQLEFLFMLCWINYQNGILVGVPAILLLMLVPNWSIHKRIQAEKRRQLVAHLRHWPMDFSLVARIVFYVLIPPLAWAGAALVELALDSYLTG